MDGDQYLWTLLVIDAAPEMRCTQRPCHKGLCQANIVRLVSVVIVLTGTAVDAVGFLVPALHSRSVLESGKAGLFPTYGSTVRLCVRYSVQNVIICGRDPVMNSIHSCLYIIVVCGSLPSLAFIYQAYQELRDPDGQ